MLAEGRGAGDIVGRYTRRVRVHRPPGDAGLVPVGCAVLGAGALDDLGDLVGELEHKPFAGDEFVRGRAEVLGLEQAGDFPQQVLADLGRAAQLVAVAAGGGLDERGVQGGEAPQIAAGAVAFDGAHVLEGPGVHPTRQVLSEQQGEEHRWQHDVDGDPVASGEQAC
ncbi:hypothetical protein [Streptomyces sp. NPDC056190]|uniref:hypothetical protein n=1 Tax=Streptomyces sp. NPDC056190 TaxID=3345741 RepID=UPI0035E087D2